MRRSAAGGIAASILLLGGFLAWSLAFLVLYALLSFGCAYGWDAVAVGPVSLNRLVLTVAWLVCSAGLGAMALGTYRAYSAESRLAGFVRRAGLALSVLALAATIANFAMVTTLSTCL